jgi:hypothetical protein
MLGTLWVTLPPLVHFGRLRPEHLASAAWYIIARLTTAGEKRAQHVAHLHIHIAFAESGAGNLNGQFGDRRNRLGLQRHGAPAFSCGMKFTPDSTQVSCNLNNTVLSDAASNGGTNPISHLATF